MGLENEAPPVPLRGALGAVEGLTGGRRPIYTYLRFSPAVAGVVRKVVNSI